MLKHYIQNVQSPKPQIKFSSLKYHVCILLWYLWVKHARTRIAVVVANKACLYAKEGNPSCLTMHLSKEKISKNSYVKHRFHKCEYANTDGHQYLCYFSLTNYCTLDFETKTSIWEWLSCKNLERNNLVHEKLKSAIFGYILYVFHYVHYVWHCFFLFFRCHDRSYYDLSWLRSKNRLATSGLSYSFGLFCILLIHVYLFHCGSGNLKSVVNKQLTKCKQTVIRNWSLLPAFSI